MYAHIYISIYIYIHNTRHIYIYIYLYCTLYPYIHIYIYTYNIYIYIYTHIHIYIYKIDRYVQYQYLPPPRPPGKFLAAACRIHAHIALIFKNVVDTQQNGHRGCRRAEMPSNMGRTWGEHGEKLDLI